MSTSVTVVVLTLAGAVVFIEALSVCSGSSEEKSNFLGLKPLKPFEAFFGGRPFFSVSRLRSKSFLMSL